MFGKKLKEIREMRGYTQQKAADLIGIALRTYQNYESGSRHPSYKRLVTICNVFDVTSDYLLLCNDSIDNCAEDATNGQ